MVTRKLKSSEKAYLKRLGKKVSKIILQERGYSSLDAFWLENDTVPKGTLYEICNGTRDFKITTFLRLASVLGMKPTELLHDEH